MHVRRAPLFRCPRFLVVPWSRSTRSLSSAPGNGLVPVSISTTTDELIKLTALARCAGCASKMGPGDLSRALANLPVITDARLLVGRETFDDAGVFRVSDDFAL